MGSVKYRTPEEKARQADMRRAQRRQWAQAHPEKSRAYGRAFYRRNATRRRADSLAYYHAHKEARSAYSRDYYARKKAEDPDYVKRLSARTRDYRRAYYTELKPRTPMSARARLLKACHRTLSRYAFESIERVRASVPERAALYLARYPFESFGQGFIREHLRKERLFSGDARYDDCYEAGMLAYLYSVHRCAALDCDYVIPYIRKMVRIYILCALLVSGDARNLCALNGLREVRLDAAPAARPY